jgi:hypothetical protein
MGKASSVPVIRVTLTPYPGTTTANWQAGEAIITTIGAIGAMNLIHSLLLDINALVGNITVRLYTDINGIQRQSYSQILSVAVDGPGLWIINGILAIYGILLVTAQSNNAADNGQAIGWEYILGGT